MPPPQPVSALAERIAALSRLFREGSKAGEIPCVGPQGFAPYRLEQPNDTQLQELRSLLDSQAPSEVRGMAAWWLTDAHDLADLSRFLRCAGSNEPAGVYPSFPTGQGYCDKLTWKEQTLGQLCLYAMGYIAHATLGSAAEAQAWMDAHPEPLDSVDYWRYEFGSRPASREQLERLYRRGPELFMRVVAQAPDLLDQTTEPMFAKAVREGVGHEQLLRVLRHEASWPELENGGFETFATTIFRRADAIFDASHRAALLAMWEDRSCCREDHVWAILAIGVSRVVPEESRRVLTSTLRQCSGGQEALLEELARRYPLEEKALLARWYGDEPRGYQDAFATAIFGGLAGAGPKARPVLASLVRKRAPSPEDCWAVEALMAATKAVGDAIPERCDRYLFARPGKTASPQERERAEREAVAFRKGCVNEALRSLRSAPKR